jgi:putative ABC transport system permease protein
MLSRLLGRARGLLSRRRTLGEFEEELQFHLEREIGRHISRGISPENARTLALRDFGGVAQARDQVRTIHAYGLDALGRDIRHAARALVAAPEFTIVALTILTLSVGVSSTAFSIVDAVLLRGLPYPDSSRLVAVTEVDRNDEGPALALPSFVAPQTLYDWRERQRAFSGLAATAYAEISIKTQDQDFPEPLSARRVTSNFFDVVQVFPIIGRPFGADNEVAGREHVAVISYDLWQRRFGGSANIVGKRLPGQLATFDIVGVMPEGFSYPVDAGHRVDVWLPFVPPPNARIRGNSIGHYLEVVGRLQPAVSLPQARADMDRISAQLAVEAPRWFAGRTARVERLQDYVAQPVRTWMLLLVGGVVCLLALATINVGNLMLARGLSRTRELAIRAALGASRGGLVRVLLLESLLLSFCGAGAGIFLAWLSVDSIRSLLPPDFPRLAGVGMNTRLVGATTVIALGIGIGFGLVSIMALTRGRVQRWLGQRSRAMTEDRASMTVRNGLVTLETALAALLLVGAVLFFASFVRASRIDIGFNVRDVLTVQLRPLALPGRTAPGSEPLERVLDRIEAAFGEHIAALTTSGLPLRGDIQSFDFAIPDQPGVTGDIARNAVSRSYFQVLDIPILHGRGFDAGDTLNGQPVMILNARAAGLFFGGGRAIGQRIRWQGETAERLIVGIAGDIRFFGPESNVRPQAFIPFAQDRPSAATILIRGKTPASVLPLLGQAISAEFSSAEMPPLAVDVKTLESYYTSMLAPRRLNMRLLGMFGLLGAAIAAIGVYGVIAYLVAQRTREIGIRLSLGASPYAIVRVVLGRTLMHVLVGLAMGLALGWVLSSSLTTLLFQVRPHDRWVYVVVGVSLFAIAVAGALVPARRATRIDPQITLRLE